MKDKKNEKAAEVNSVASPVKCSKAQKKRNVLQISRNKILQGIIFSEILGEPKGRRGR